MRSDIYNMIIAQEPSRFSSKEMTLGLRLLFLNAYLSTRNEEMYFLYVRSKCTAENIKNALSSCDDLTCNILSFCMNRQQTFRKSKDGSVFLVASNEHPTGSYPLKTPEMIVKGDILSTSSRCHW